MLLSPLLTAASLPSCGTSPLADVLRRPSLSLPNNSHPRRSLAARLLERPPASPSRPPWSSPWRIRTGCTATANQITGQAGTTPCAGDDKEASTLKEGCVAYTSCGLLAPKTNRVAALHPHLHQNNDWRSVKTPHNLWGKQKRQRDA